MRIKILGGLRALAIFIVILCYYYVYFKVYNFIAFAIIFSFGIGVLLYEVFEKNAAKKLYNLLLSSKN